MSTKKIQWFRKVGVENEYDTQKCWKGVENSLKNRKNGEKPVFLVFWKNYEE